MLEEHVPSTPTKPNLNISDRQPGGGTLELPPACSGSMSKTLCLVARPILLTSPHPQSLFADDALGVSIGSSITIIDYVKPQDDQMLVTQRGLL
jgi:hypothetical protein